MTREVLLWAVKYQTAVECEYGFEHKISNILVGLSKEKAKFEAEYRKGKVVREWFTPEITDDEITLLNSEGVPVIRSAYGLGFKDVPMAFNNSPADLDDVRMLYWQVKH